MLGVTIDAVQGIESLGKRLSSEFSRAQLSALYGLTVDRATAEVVAALDAEGIRALLIKGPALTRWLYPESSSRGYRDIDLMVAPATRARAEGVLERLGFEPSDAELTEAERAELEAEREIAGHARTWTREGASVDLHHTIVGLNASPSAVWEALAAGSESVPIAGQPVDIPAEGCRALIVALEAAKGGPADPKGLGDLDRALAVVPESLWREAASLARRLGALSAFSAGLGLLPAGKELARRLAVHGEVDVETALRVQSAPQMAFGFQRLADRQGVRAKITFVARKVVPSRLFMRHRFAIARRGRIGLVLAYLWRPLWLLMNSPRGFHAWRRARTRGAQ